MAATIGTPVAANPLSRFVDKARVLVISAPSATDRKLHDQDHDLASFSAEMNDRDLVVIHLIGDQARDTRADSLDAVTVRRAAGLEPDRFGVALIGKDGGVKLRRKTPIAVPELFRVIDAMPMRRDEMKRNGKR